MSPSFFPTGIRFEKIDKRYGGLFAARLARPSSGIVTFVDRAKGVAAERVQMGFVGHATMVYDELTAEENLLLFARLLGITEPAARTETLLGEVGLSDRRSSLVRTFSRGMRQRVAIARDARCRPNHFDEPSWRVGDFDAGYAGDTTRSRIDLVGHKDGRQPPFHSYVRRWMNEPALQLDGAAWQGATHGVPLARTADHDRCLYPRCRCAIQFHV